jgi:hypothetical protein
MKKLINLIVIAMLLSSCAPTKYIPTKTSLELQAIQAKEFNTNKTTAFASVLSVFQDLGYMVTSSEIQTGYITAKSPTQNEVGLTASIMKDTKATAFIEELVPGKTKIRLNFVSSEEWSSGYGNKMLQDNPIEDDAVYNNAFNKIQEAIFLRTPFKGDKP